MIDAASTLNPPSFELSIRLSEDSGLTDTARQNRELLYTAYKNMAAGDGEAIARLLDPEVVFIEAEGLPYGVSASGIEGALQGVAGMFGAWSQLRAEFLEFLAGGDLVIAYLIMTGIARATGQTYSGPTAELFRFRNGKIIEWRPIYWDTHAVRKVCGLA
jgi:ketosteroid isomerase-like protein